MIELDQPARRVDVPPLPRGNCVRAVVSYGRAGVNFVELARRGRDRQLNLARTLGPVLGPALGREGRCGG